nr:MAG TPA: hypothetical protein [Caudoviricetes sp.]
MIRVLSYNTNFYIFWMRKIKRSKDFILFWK